MSLRRLRHKCPAHDATSQPTNYKRRRARAGAERRVTSGQRIAVGDVVAGEALIKEVFPAFNRHERQFISALNDEEVATLSTLLRKIVAQRMTEATVDSKSEL